MRRIVFLDWDSAAKLVLSGALYPKAGLIDKCKYLEVPNDHFWGFETGTRPWAAISQLLGYHTVCKCYILSSKCRQ